jgi:excisionase family DNA binding protein
MTGGLELFTIVEAAELLRVPEGWLRKRVSAHAVPHTRLGKHVRFTAEQLREITAKAELQPVSVPSNTNGLSPRARRAAC